MSSDKQIQPKSKSQRSLAVEGTIFWLVASAIISFGAIATTSEHVVEGIILAVLYLIIAYLCWIERRIGFLFSIILNLVVAVIAFPLLLGGEATPKGALIDALEILSALLTVFFGYRAYREAK